MRAISLILIVVCLGLSGCVCFQQKTQVSSVKLLEISGDASTQQYTASKTDGFLANNFSGKMQLGQSALGDFSYELYYHMAIGNGAGAICSDADFTLRGLVMEKENGELIGIRFLRELTGKISYDKGKMTVGSLSKSPSFVNLTVGALKSKASRNTDHSPNGISIDEYYFPLNAQFLPNPADQVNRLELVFDLTIQTMPTRPSFPAN